MDPEQSNLNTIPKNTVMAILAYLGPLIIISYVAAKDDPFVKFHIKQGLVLLVIEFIVWALSMFIFLPFLVLWQLLNLATLVLSIVGIVNAIKGREKELPLIGGYAKHFTF